MAAALAALNRPDDADRMLDAAFDLAKKQGAHAFGIGAALAAVEAGRADADWIERLEGALADAETRAVRPYLTKARRLTVAGP